MIQTRIGATLAVACLLLSATASQALASHGGGGGGGGGGGTTTAPATAPVVSFSQPAFTFGPQELGTTSPAQTVTLTNTGTGALFVNFVGQSGPGGLDYTITDDQCLGTFTAAGASCTMTFTFTPHATGTRTATVSLTDNAANSPQAITLTGTGTSVNGPTPLSVDTTGLNCNAGVCDLTTGGSSIVKNFYYGGVSAQGDTVAPFTWTLVSGTLPSGLTLFSDGEIYGTPTTTGTSAFTVRVTDANGQTATQQLSLTVSPPPPPLTSLQQSCQHAPSQATANLAGRAIAGKTPSGQAVGDQSQLTACGGFTTIKASVKDVNLPNGTVLWVALGGRVIGRIVLNNGTATMAPWVTTQSLRQQGISVDTQPPSGDPTRVPVLSGKFG
jgi:putative Ig domain-containing protein/ASPM-SPD-2-Hydin domain-containing protein